MSADPACRITATCRPGTAIVADTIAACALAISLRATYMVGSRNPLPELRYWPRTAPMTVSLRPPTVNVAEKSRQPPAWSVDPVLMPSTPS
jgi:hypothetical protein